MGKTKNGAVIMKNAVVFISYNLKKGVSEDEFLQATQQLESQEVKHKKGYISWNQLKSEDIWVDLLTFETMEDARAFEKNDTPSELAMTFYSFIDFNTVKSRFYTIEKKY